MSNGVRNISVFAEDLALLIIATRSQQMEVRYFEETTKKRYEKWFTDNGSGRKPFLDELRHGGAITVDENGKAHYWMLNRKLYHMKKRGKHFYPVRSEMASAVKEYLGMMYEETMRPATKTKSGMEITITLPYTKMPPEYGSEYSVSFNGCSTEKQFYKRGKNISTVDKLIIDSIAKWSSDNMLVVDVESRME